MRKQARILASAFALAAAVQAGVWIAVPDRAGEDGLPRTSSAQANRADEPRAAEMMEAVRAGPETEARTAHASVPQPGAARKDLRRSVAGLARLEPAGFRLADYEQLAGALASELGAQAADDLSRLAADTRVPANERVASAEILRHLGPAPAPESAVACLRAAWGARASEPALAACAVRALGAFGNAGDRAALLERSLDATQPDQAALALAGLSAARGDDAALELAAAAQLTNDPRRSEIGLAALCAIAASDSGGLSPWVRAQCADAIEHTLAAPQTHDASFRRKLCAIAVLDPARSAAH